MLASVQTARDLGSWRAYRFAVVILGEVLLKLDKGLGEKVKELMMGIWEGVLGGEDEEVRALGALALGKAEVEISLEREGAEVLGTSQPSFAER